MKQTLIVILTCGLLSLVSSLEEELVKDQQCGQALPNPHLNVTWLSSVERWYTPYWSKLEAYRFYSDFLEKDIKDLTEQALTNSCISIDRGFTVHAFDKSVNDSVKVTFDDATHTDLHFKIEKDHGLVGAYHQAKTDNENYIVGLTCWEDNQLTWDILSPKPTLDDKAKKDAFDFLQSMGFKTDAGLVEETKYDNCNIVV